MVFISSEETTAATTVQGLHTQEGQLISMSETDPCASINSGMRGPTAAQRQDLPSQGLPASWAYFNRR